MSDILKNLRAFGQGKLSESALADAVSPDDGYDFENDTEFMQECFAAALPLYLQTALCEGVETMDEDTKNAFIQVQDYMVAQGLMDEAATVRITNPKVNVVHLNKAAQIKRLTTIITLKMARKSKSKNYTKYKMGQKIKVTNMEEMRKKFGAKAEKLAKKVWQQTQKNKKVAAVVETNKDEKASKPAAKK